MTKQYHSPLLVDEYMMRRITETATTTIPQKHMNLWLVSCWYQLAWARFSLAPFIFLSAELIFSSPSFMVTPTSSSFILVCSAISPICVISLSIQTKSALSCSSILLLTAYLSSAKSQPLSESWLTQPISLTLTFLIRSCFSSAMSLSFFLSSQGRYVSMNSLFICSILWKIQESSSTSAKESCSLLNYLLTFSYSNILSAIFRTLPSAWISTIRFFNLAMQPWMLPPSLSSTSSFCLKVVALFSSIMVGLLLSCLSMVSIVIYILINREGGFPTEGQGAGGGQKIKRGCCISGSWGNLILFDQVDNVNRREEGRDKACRHERGDAAGRN